MAGEGDGFITIPPSSNLCDGATYERVARKPFHGLEPQFVTIESVTLKFVTRVPQFKLFGLELFGLEPSLPLPTLHAPFQFVTPSSIEVLVAVKTVD